LRQTGFVYGSYKTEALACLLSFYCCRTVKLQDFLFTDYRRLFRG